MTKNSTQTPYELIGGASIVLNLVDKFYFYMDILPEAQDVRSMHGKSLSGAKDKLFKFLSGWLGGPDLFVQEFGHPMLRRRHFPFAIGSSEKEQWMICMSKAMNEISMDSGARENILEAIDQLATHMINQ